MKLWPLTSFGVSQKTRTTFGIFGLLPTGRKEETGGICPASTSLILGSCEECTSVLVWQWSAQTSSMAHYSGQAVAPGITQRTHTTHWLWHPLVWNVLNCPRDALHSWLCACGRLPTKDKLISRGVNVSSVCPLCSFVDESEAHLYFECSWSKNVLAEVMTFLKIDNYPSSWRLMIPLFASMPRRRLRTNMIAATISKLVNLEE